MAAEEPPAEGAPYPAPAGAEYPELEEVTPMKRAPLAAATLPPRLEPPPPLLLRLAPPGAA